MTEKELIRQVCAGALKFYGRREFDVLFESCRNPDDMLFLCASFLVGSLVGMTGLYPARPGNLLVEHLCRLLKAVAKEVLPAIKEEEMTH